MEPQRVERKLAAILAADVAGYSRLMEAEEEATLARLKFLRRELIDPKIKEHHGRIVKTTGDGALVEFPSVVEAVRCAAEVQEGMVGRNADVPKDRRIEFRIGVNLGDIIVDPDDIHGDGVNVAARLQQLAQPGGVAVSRTVVDHVKHKLALRFVSLGEQRLKNIAEPVEVYRIRLEPGVTAAAPRRQWRARLVAVAALLIAIGVAGTAYMKNGASPDEPPKEIPPLDAQVWQAIRDSTNPADFEAYLRIFPTGPVAELARKRLKALLSARHPPASTPWPGPPPESAGVPPKELAARAVPPPVETPQPPASTEAPTSTTPAPTPQQQADVAAATPAVAPAAAPQQQAMVAPDVSKSVASPTLPDAPYDGEWKGIGLGGHGCAGGPCGGTVNVKVAKNVVSGKLESHAGTAQLSGTIAKDGSFTGTLSLGDAHLSGKFDENRFEGLIISAVPSPISGGAVFLERVK